MDRRTALRGLGGLAAVAVGGVSASAIACGMRSDAADQAALRLSVALPDIIQPERLARWVLTAASDAAPVRSTEWPSVMAELTAIECDAARRAAIAAQVRRDFARGDVVVADRIVVARTECLIAALCMHRPPRAGTVRSAKVWQGLQVRTT